MVLGTSPGETITDSTGDVSITSDGGDGGGFGGWTGDPDTSLVEYGGFVGFALADTSDDADPIFNTGEEQAEGAPILRGGWNQEEGESVDPSDVPGVPDVPYKALFAVVLVGAFLYLLAPLIQLTDTLAGG